VGVDAGDRPVVEEFVVDGCGADDEDREFCGAGRDVLPVECWCLVGAVAGVLAGDRGGRPVVGVDCWACEFDVVDGEVRALRGGELGCGFGVREGGEGFADAALRGGAWVVSGGRRGGFGAGGLAGGGGGGCVVVVGGGGCCGGGGLGGV